MQTSQLYYCDQGGPFPGVASVSVQMLSFPEYCSPHKEAEDQRANVQGHSRLEEMYKMLCSRKVLTPVFCFGEREE